MKVSDLIIYPIKGMGGVHVEEAKCLPEGFEHDRRWMLINKEGVFISQRSHPRLALFSTEIKDDSIQVWFANNSCNIPLDLFQGEEIGVSVFDDQMIGTIGDPAISRWFSECLEDEVLLAQHSPKTQRIKTTIKGPQTPVSFADGYPYLILGTASLKELNNRLTSPLGMDRFRPNIVVKTDQAHEEDDWDVGNIGTVRFQVVKPCARCQVPTIDQQSGERGVEPTKTLASYRKIGNKIFFGSNAISLGPGTIKVNDMVAF